MNHRTTFIVNPTSSSGRTKRRFDHLTPLVRELFKDCEVRLTNERAHATELTRQAIREGSELVVAVGGDGTANEVVNGFFENGALISNKVKLAILMSGTGGDLRRSIGMPKDLKAGLTQIKNGSSAAIDVGLVYCRQADGSFEHRYFLNAASLGLSAHTALLVRNEIGKQSRLAYVLAAIKALRHSRPQILHLLVDGEKRTINDVSLLAFANASYFGGAMHIAPHASMIDGLADVICVSNINFFMMAKNIVRLYRGTHLDIKEVTHFRTSRIEVESPAHVFLVETDGEPCGQLPATFEILKHSIQLQR